MLGARAQWRAVGVTVWNARAQVQGEPDSAAHEPTLVMCPGLKGEGEGELEVGSFWRIWLEYAVPAPRVRSGGASPLQIVCGHILHFTNTRSKGA